MKAEEIYLDIVKKISEITGVGENDIIKSRTEESSDARFLLVKALAKLSMTDIEIAKLMGKTRKGVTYIRQNNSKMDKWLVGRNWVEIGKWVGSKYYIRL